MGTSGQRRALILATASLLALASCSMSTPVALPTVTLPTVTLPTVTLPTDAATTPPTTATQVSPTAPPTTTQGVGPSQLGSAGLPGVNDPSCSSEHRPVVLLHGTFSTMRSNFAAMASALQAADRCVFGIDYGFGGRRPVRQSAESVTAFVNEVLTTTGADQVDVVAFSQGGLVLRTALRQDGLSDKVAVAVLIAPSFHGSTSSLLDALPPGACPACTDQTAGSALLTELDAGGDLDGDVNYAVVSSSGDTVVTPVASQVPNGPADRVRSLLVQDQCPGEVVDHISLSADPGVIAWTVDALNNGGAPNPAALFCR
jgi:triacylglycerol lipase